MLSPVMTLRHIYLVHYKEDFCCNHVKPRHDAETTRERYINMMEEVATMLSPVMTLRLNEPNTIILNIRLQPC